jgi:maltose phosphorylase
MPKVANRYLEVDPWRIIEKSFHPEQSLVSESIFALANEYLGVRGYFEEGYSGQRLVGSYCNGFYEEAPVAQAASYKGFIHKTRFMVNTVDWLWLKIRLAGETLDLARSAVSDFQRVLDLRTGLLEREFIWRARNGQALRVSLQRLVSMTHPHLGWQRIRLTPLNFSGPVELEAGLDFAPVHEEQGENFWSCPRRELRDDGVAMLGQTIHLGRRLFAAFKLNLPPAVTTQPVEREKYSGLGFSLQLRLGETSTVDKAVTYYAAKESGSDPDAFWRAGMAVAELHSRLTFDEVFAQQQAYWAGVWERSDIAIQGDPQNQQGIRFCIFQLYQTLRGADPGANIGAKGLTGEAYNGHTFWDTETYCLPFYLFNNPAAARSLLEFRHRTLPQALERAKELDCDGAFYPIATIDGTESCGLWQHASLQLQVGSAVAYGIRHYVKVSEDREFLYRQGVEMLIQISRCYASRGLWSPRSGEFGFYGVMGPDEFQLMVNHNCYLNFMARKTFEYTLATLQTMQSACPDRLADVAARTGLRPEELADWEKKAAKMRLPQDRESGVYEEHDGFFDLPHLDIREIPVTDFPLYHHWSYDRLYRYDMIKQPDVLMFIFLYNQEFSPAVKRANYDYYEPRCIHESSLSPSIHSILATELGYHGQAFEFCRFATRLDLDNYNRNTGQGLHTTSLAAAWMNIVYGFGGMRSDGERLLFRPVLPRPWQAYRFRIRYRGSTIAVAVGKENAEFQVVDGPPVRIGIYDEEYSIDAAGRTVAIPETHRV